MKSFAGLLATSFGISRTLHRKGRSQSLKLMKTFLTVSVFAAVAAITLSAAASPAASPAQPVKSGWTNFLIDNFQKGGPIMWPILIVSIIAVAVVLERAFWWIGRWMRRDPKRIEKVFTAIETGDVTEAS